MIKIHDDVNENKTEHNPNWLYISDHPYRILTIGGSGPGKLNELLNLLINRLNIDKIYQYQYHKYQF